jgi:hypothetical protein
MFRLSQPLESALKLAIEQSGKSPRDLAADVKRLSDYYIERPGSQTPWRESFAADATLAYFTPLNYARLLSAFQEVERFLPQERITEIHDFGSGLGATHWALADQAWLSSRPLYCREISRDAVERHRRLADLRGSQWTARFDPPRTPAKGALAVFSYSFLEIANEKTDLSDFEHLLIVEPSTQERGRELMRWRSVFMDRGYQPLAPCTHSEACPLLVHSPRDWCHHRIAFEGPSWWQEIESHLPMKNRTLTYSYMLMSRTVSDEKWRGALRVIGDRLYERGKTRQMACRGPEREFLSWLHRHGEPPDVPRGALIDLQDFEKKGNELRVTGELSTAYNR